ncbi:MAG: hypothetical protein II998_06405 [Clostridia bacterium]|nr:hypothetical protein [Clostridia bacterium]
MAFKMKKNNDEYEFVYRGIMNYKPNKSSVSGYGSDDWFYLCTYQNRYCLLSFSDSGGYGTNWECAFITDDEANMLMGADLDLWIKTYSNVNSQSKISGLHLENINEVRRILPKRSRCQEFSDRHYY